MSPPLRPSAAPSRPADRPEPRLSGSAPEPLRARAPSARPAETGASPPLRFPSEARHAHDLPRLDVTAADRIIVSSPNPGRAKRRRGVLGSLGLIVLCLLAAVGAYALYHGFVDTFLR